MTNANDTTPDAAEMNHPMWAVTLKIHRTNSLRIVCVRAPSISRAIAFALETTRPIDGIQSAPSKELLRCINFAEDAIAFNGLRVGGVASVSMTVNSQVFPLPLRLDLNNNDPAGFAWGNGGAGGNQLSLAICSQLFGDDQAQRCYHVLKERFFAGLQRDAWTLSASAVRQVVGGAAAGER